MKKLVLEQTKSIVDSQVVFTTAVQESLHRTRHESFVTAD